MLFRQEYDTTLIGLIVVMLVMVFGVLGGCAGLVKFHVSQEVYAKRLSYQADVLRNR